MKIDNMREEHQEKPVSYTHLDVYKRQVLIDQKREIERLAPAALRLAFTLEDEQRTRQMLALYQEVFLNKAEIGELPFEFTRGHFKRGIK